MTPARGENVSLADTSMTGEKTRPGILIVDDEAAILFAYRRLIEAGGYRADSCETLADAIRLVNERPYLAIITDMQLGGTGNSDGRSLLEYVLKYRPQTKVLLVSGCGDDGVEGVAAIPGASWYFKKPVDPVVILETLITIHEQSEG